MSRSLPYAVILLVWCLASTVSAQTNRARDLVNPFIGTGGHGHTFPGACVPNGMVQLSPDTRADGYNDWDGCGGYHHSDSLIYGFSHTHLSGTGVADLCDVLLMPMSGYDSLLPEEYRTPFKHGSEVAQAGYYKVHLDSRPIPDPNKINGRPVAGIDVELTATARNGIHRYSFPSGEDAYMVLDLRHRDKVTQSHISTTQADDKHRTTEVTGFRRSSSWARDQQLYFCIRFSRPAIALLSSSASDSGSVQPIKELDGTDLSGVFNFGDLKNEPLIIKVGISSVSIDGARKNLDTEVPGWDFDAVRQQAEAAWNAKLNKIQVEGGTKEEQRTFYTALYHSYVAPYIFNDVDGNYRGLDGSIHHADHNVYTVFSLWDTFRALHPLMTVLEPEMTSDWIKTFLLHYQQGGRLPVWELWGNETDCMIGYHSVSVIADAYAKGIRGFDAELALEAMVAAAEEDHFGLKAYREKGYISSEDAPESVSRTLEYAYDDWCIARMAEEMLRTPSWDKYRADRFDSLATAFRERSRNWQNLFDPDTKFFRARRNGGFIERFDPYEVNFNFTEANAWQYGFFIPHDMRRYADQVGGPGGLAQRLDALFTANERTTGRDQSDISGLIGQYAHGNEPSHNFAYLYGLSDRPWSMDNYVARIRKELYRDAPDGLSGNEDCGQMSAWYVWSAIGLYPTSPGLPEYTIGHPLFDEVRIDPGSGKSFTITASVLANDRSYVETVLWNGAPPAKHRTLPHAAMLAGGELHFELGPRPGSGPAEIEQGDNASPDRWTPVPIIQAPAPSFTDSMQVRILSSDPSAELEFAVDKSTRKRYTGPFWIHRSCTVEAFAKRAEQKGGPETTASAWFTELDGMRKLQLGSNYSNQYAAGGEQALLDGIRGGPEFRAGQWQGFQGQDLVANIDLGRVTQVKRIGLSVLQDQKSWIWLPSQMTVSVSTNQRQWSSRTIEQSVDKKAEGSLLYEIWTEVLDRRIRYITIVAKNAGPCPDWHPSAGGSTWIFADEILIETDP